MHADMEEVSAIMCTAVIDDKTWDHLWGYEKKGVLLAQGWHDGAVGALPACRQRGRAHRQALIAPALLH